MKYCPKKMRTPALPFCINGLFSCTKICELDSMVESLIVVTNCETASPVVKKHFENLKQCNADVLTWKTKDINEENINEDQQSLYVTKYLDKKQEKKSPFFLRYRSKLDMFLASETYT